MSNQEKKQRILSGEIDKGRLEGRDVREDHSFAAGVRIWRRHVEVEHGESPLLALSLQHRNRVGVVVQYSASQLQVRISNNTLKSINIFVRTSLACCIKTPAPAST